MSLIDISYQHTRPTNITLPPISSIIKSLEPSLPQHHASHVLSSSTSPIPAASQSTGGLITNNNNIPTLIPKDSYTHYTYSTARSNSSDSLSSSPSSQLLHQPIQPIIQQQPIIQIPDNIVPIQQEQINQDLNPTIKRKYTCKTCSKSFTTSGHLARHSRIHTGERKHVCPFPNCESRFARQDNCMQHYKTHLNNKLRKRKYNKKLWCNSRSIYKEFYTEVLSMVFLAYDVLCWHVDYR